MSTTTAISANAVKPNGTATMINAGAASSTSVKNISLGIKSNTVGANVPPTGFHSGTLNTTTGRFAYWPTSSSEVIALGLCNKIGGVASTALTMTGSDKNRASIHGKITRYTTPITSWDYATGVATTGTATTDSFGTDYAITVSAAVPGNIVVMENGKTITEYSY
jgi:hypothetical protein